MSIKPRPFDIFDYTPLPVWVNELKNLMRLYEPADGNNDDDSIRNSDIIMQIEQICSVKPGEIEVLHVLVDMGFKFKVKPYRVIVWRIKQRTLPDVCNG